MRKKSQGKGPKTTVHNNTIEGQQKIEGNAGRLFRKTGLKTRDTLLSHCNAFQTGKKTNRDGKGIGYYHLWGSASRGGRW